MFDDIFGGMFDFNVDAHTDFMEEATGFAVIEEMMNDQAENESEFDTEEF